METMYLETLLRTHLLRELTEEISDHPELQDPPRKTDALRQAKQKVSDLTIDTLITDPRLRGQVTTCTVPEDERCEARTWANHTGTRCTRRTHDQYCKIHQRMLEETDYLVFGRYDEDRPVFNESGNRIPWYDESPIASLDILLRYQQMDLEGLISGKGD
jgi:hypothetical protein